jgi:hypothetical protein
VTQDQELRSGLQHGAHAGPPHVREIDGRAEAAVILEYEGVRHAAGDHPPPTCDVTQAAAHRTHAVYFERAADVPAAQEVLPAEGRERQRGVAGIERPAVDGVRPVDDAAQFRRQPGNQLAAHAAPPFPCRTEVDTQNGDGHGGAL